MSDRQTFKTRVAGNPPGVVYRVRHPSAGVTFNFHGQTNGRLTWTVADLGDALDDTGEPTPAAAAYHLDLADQQLAVAQGAPVLWVCQHARDGRALANLFTHNEVAGRWPGQEISVVVDGGP